MSSNVKIRLNSAGVRELLKSAEAQGICMEYAQQVQRAAGEHFVAEKRNYPKRSGAAVRPDDAEGHYSNLKHNTLVKALQSAKGGGK